MNFSSSENTFYREDADEQLTTLMLRRRRRRRQRSQRGNSLPPTSDLFTFIAAPPLRTPPPPSPVSQRRAARWRRQYRPMMIVHVPVHARAADAGRTGRPLAAASRRRDHSGHACLAYRRRVITVSRRPRCRPDLPSLLTTSRFAPAFSIRIISVIVRPRYIMELVQDKSIVTIEH